ncbi:MAG TPA: hypothetical protein VKO20_06850, partial [Desulfosalsimonadaceae bacterium]|nr:hypothetical protein [Desulfosalsimonadaceae bacterium]
MTSAGGWRKSCDIFREPAEIEQLLGSGIFSGSFAHEYSRYKQWAEPEEELAPAGRLLAKILRRNAVAAHDLLQGLSLHSA